MFRLHLDLPLKISETESAEITKAFVEFLTQNKDTLTSMGIADINYRLGHDDDRQKSNYMIKNHNGHVANKKSRIHLIPQNPDVEYIGLE